MSTSTSPLVIISASHECQEFFSLTWSVILEVLKKVQHSFDVLSGDFTQSLLWCIFGFKIWGGGCTKSNLIARPSAR